MYQMQEKTDQDELKARFTAWLDIVAYRTRLKYIRKLEQQVQTISLDELDENSQPTTDQDMISEISSIGTQSFMFEEQKLARAFAELPIKRQRILEMLFVDEKKPSEIAKALNCTEAYVYNQKHRALEKLRSVMEKDGAGC